jgi:hypothetical protein
VIPPKYAVARVVQYIKSQSAKALNPVAIYRDLLPV